SVAGSMQDDTRLYSAARPAVAPGRARPGRRAAMAFPQQAPAVEAIQEARRLIAAGDRPRAVRVLEAFLARMPPGWRPRTETKEELQVAFWNMEEFLQFAALHQAAGDRRKVTWVRPAYGEACYLLGYLAVEEGDYAAARRHVERGLGLE